MAGPACKVAINQGFRALTESVERILLDPQLNKGLIPEDRRKDLVQRLADIDIAAYCGTKIPAGGLSGILLELEALKLISPDVWKIYVRPTI